MDDSGNQPVVMPDRIVMSPFRRTKVYQLSVVDLCQHKLSLIVNLSGNK